MDQWDESTKYFDKALKIDPESEYIKVAQKSIPFKKNVNLKNVK